MDVPIQFRSSASLKALRSSFFTSIRISCCSTREKKKRKERAKVEKLLTRNMREEKLNRKEREKQEERTYKKEEGRARLNER